MYSPLVPGNVLVGRDLHGKGQRHGYEIWKFVCTVAMDTNVNLVKTSVAATFSRDCSLIKGTKGLFLHITNLVTWFINKTGVVYVNRIVLNNLINLGICRFHLLFLTRPRNWESQHFFSRCGYPFDLEISHGRQTSTSFKRF